MEKLIPIVLTPFAVVAGVATPGTYILAVVHTWQTNASVLWKLLISLTLDVLISVFWPITWILWTVMHYAGKDTPLRLLFG